MDENKIGQFIAELRKEKKLTQKDLAAQLHITDKAVSKWERGLSCPDITLLTSVADILGVTTGELLNGQRSETLSKDIEKTVDNALIYAEKSAKRKMVSFQNVLTISFSVLLLLGIIVCSICDMAISGTFTWSLYPISSCLFAWLVFVPLVKYGNKGIRCSLVSFSIIIIPFLYVISKIIGDSGLIMSIGIKVCLLSTAYLWCVYLISKRLITHKLKAAAFSLLLAIPLCLAINITLSKYISEPMFDIWDVFSFGIIIIGAVTLFIIDYYSKRKEQ